MVIGIDASRANKLHKTGTEWYAYYLIRNFAKLDSKNQYILYTNEPLTGGLFDLEGDDIKGRKRDNKPVFDEDGYQVLKSPHGNFKAKILKWPFQFFWTLGGLSVEMFFRKPDILFIPSHVLPFFHPKKSIVTIHDIGFIKDSSLFAKDNIGPETLSIRWFINKITRIFTLGAYGANPYDYLRWSTKLALKRASKVITVSHFSKRELLEHYGKKYEPRIEVIYNGFDNKLYRKIDDKKAIDDLLLSYGIEGPYFFYIGRLEKKKNTANLVEAFAILKDKHKELKHKLVLVGDASYGYDEIKYMMREFDIVDDVIMPGWVEEEAIPYFFNGASAFIFPSRYEGFGIPLLEAMACAAPIATSRISSIPEVAGDAAEYFHPDYALSIAESMYNIINDEEKAEYLANKGRERAKNFSWDKCARETHKLITE